jgi:endonuclease/exonuclease/phosphatase (EEP) superfamily protein YafD
VSAVPANGERVIRLATHNVYVGNKHPAADLAKLAKDAARPHAIAVQEARHLTRPPHGYQRVALDEPPHPDHLGTQLLVRDDVPVIRRRVLPCGGPWWTGPKHSLRHPPPIHVGATVEVAGIRWDLLSVHGVWTGPRDRNTDTRRAELRALREWMLARQDRNDGTRPVIPLGDWNARAADLTELAHVTHARIALEGIDGALAVNVAHVSTRELPGRYGSDGHQPVLVTATRPAGR